MQLQRLFPSLAWWTLVNKESLLADAKAGQLGNAWHVISHSHHAT